MKCRFSRHLLRGDEVTWPSEVPEDGRPQLRVPERWRWNDAFTFVETVRFLRNDCVKTLSLICMSDTISRQTMQWLAIFQYDSTGQGLFQASKQLCAFYCCKTFPFLQDWCLQGPAFLELVSDWPSVKFSPLNTLVKQKRLIIRIFVFNNLLCGAPWRINSAFLSH